MVDYLCEQGADVNAGQRSSSLHYAACFGRVGITKVLLRSGANCGLTDEDGKTALEKARERQEDGHREVAALLEDPAAFLAGDEEIGDIEDDDQAVQPDRVRSGHINGRRAEPAAQVCVSFSSVPFCVVCVASHSPLCRCASGGAPSRRQDHVLLMRVPPRAQGRGPRVHRLQHAHLRRLPLARPRNRLPLLPLRL